MDREYEATMDSEGHFEFPSEVRERYGFRNGSKLKIAEEGEKVVIQSATKNIIDPRPVDKAAARAALEKAIGFMGTDGRALKMLIEERRRGDGL